MWKVKMTPGFKALARRVRLTLDSLDTLVERLSSNPQSGDFLGHFHGFDVRQLRWSKFMVVFEVHEPSKTIRLTALVPWSPDLSEGLSFRRIVKKIILGLLAAAKFIDEARELAEKFGIDIDFSDDEDDTNNLMQAAGTPFEGLLCADRNNLRKAVGSETSERRLICCEPGIGKMLAFESLISAAKSSKPAVPGKRYKSHNQKRRYRVEDRLIAEEAGNVARLQFDQSGQSLTTNTRDSNDLATSLYAWLTPYNHWFGACNVMTTDCVTDALGESDHWMWGVGEPDGVIASSNRDLFATYIFVVDIDDLWAGDEPGARGRYFICSDAGLGKSLAFANWSFTAQSVRETPARGDSAPASQETLWESKEQAMAEDSNDAVPLLLNPRNKSLMTNLRGSNGSTTGYVSSATTKPAAYVASSCASYATTSYAAYVTTSRAAYNSTTYDSYHYGFSAFYLGFSYDISTMFGWSYQLKANGRSSQSVTTKSANNLLAPRSSACDLASNYRFKPRHARQSDSTNLDLYLDCNHFSSASYSRDGWKISEFNRRQTVLRGKRWTL